MKAILFKATPTECGLLVKAMRQFTQSVKVAVSVSVMWLKCSRTIFSMVSKDSRTIVGSLSPVNARTRRKGVLKLHSFTVHSNNTKLCVKNDIA